MSIELSKSYQFIASKRTFTHQIHPIIMQNIIKDQSINVFDLQSCLSIDYLIQNKICKIKNHIKDYKLKDTSKQNVVQQKQIQKQLKSLMQMLKKMEFYRLTVNLKNLFYDQNGLGVIYQMGSLESIYYVSQIQKFKENNEQNDLTQLQIEIDESKIIFRDVCLKLAKHALTQLKKQMYIPSKQLSIGLLRVYGLTYNFQKSFYDNYTNSLIQKKVNQSIGSKQPLIVFQTLKIAISLQTLQGLCYFLSYLKNSLLDRNSGMLNGDYEIWQFLFQSCLKIYSRHPECYQKQLLQIDQILSVTYHDEQFFKFLVKNVTNNKVSLSSINFYLRNTKKQQRNQLRKYVEQKIQKMNNDEYWQNFEHILYFIDSEFQKNQKSQQIKIIIQKIKDIIFKQVKRQNTHHILFGLTSFFQDYSRYFQSFADILDQNILNQLNSFTKQTDSTKLILGYNLFNLFLTYIYMQVDYQNWQLNVQDIFKLALKFNEMGLVCSKSALKLIYHYHCVKDQESLQNWQELAQLFVQHYVCGNFEQNSDLQLIHSRLELKQLIILKFIQKIQVMIAKNVKQNQQMIQILKKTTDKTLQKSYLNIRSFRDKVLFQSCLNMCYVLGTKKSIKLIQLGLYFCSPLVKIQPWSSSQQSVNNEVLNLICEQIPIQILKFIYKQVCVSPNFFDQKLQQLPCQIWNNFWNNKCKQINLQYLVQDHQIYQNLQKLRRFQFVINLTNCVFDKLNENSQKNIKEIRLVFQSAAKISKKIISPIIQKFIQMTSINYLKQIQKLSIQQINQLKITGDQDDSFTSINYIQSNNFIKIIKQFALVGKASENIHVNQVLSLCSPSFDKIDYQYQNQNIQKISKIIACILALESNEVYMMYDGQSIVFDKQWCQKYTLFVIDLYKILARTVKNKEDKAYIFSQKLSQHLRGIISRLVLPSSLSLLLTRQNKNGFSKNLCLMIRSTIQLIYIIDIQYEQHFILLIQRLEQILKQGRMLGKDQIKAQSSQILIFLELLLELVFEKIRIRSYHLYRVIKYYQKATNQPITQLNSMVSNYIGMLFQKFIPNYKPLNEIQKLCLHKKNNNQNFQKLIKTELNMNYIEYACTLSMFINLFCRLNFASLSTGIQKILNDQESKIVYLDYLSSLTKIIAEGNLNVCPRDLQVLKIDVYGNLNVVMKGHTNTRIIQKLVELTRNMLKVQVDLKQINKLPSKILAQKIQNQNLQINLQQFEEQYKAMSLGVLNLYKRLSKYINSNLHLCNLYYITGKNIQKYIQLNDNLFNGYNKSQLTKQIKSLENNNILQNCKIKMTLQVEIIIKKLLNKIQHYYPLIKQTQNTNKLYSLIKILSITCINLPQITAILLKQKIFIQQKQHNFVDFVIDTLQHCLPIFCQFYISLIKSNSGFFKIDQQILSQNIVYQIQIKNKLLNKFKQSSQNVIKYPFISGAISFVQRQTQNNRFRLYKFSKSNNSMHENILKQYQKQFNNQILKNCRIILQNNKQSQINIQIYEVLSSTLQKYQNCSQLQKIKLQNESLLHQKYHLLQSQQNKQNHHPHPHIKNIQAKSKSKEHKQYKQCQSAKYKARESISTIIYQNIIKKLTQKSQNLKSNFTQLVQTIKHGKNIYIRQQIIALVECKKTANSWRKKQLKEQSSINEQMIKRFQIFNQQIQGRQFLKDSMMFSIKKSQPIEYETQISNIVQQEIIQEADGIIQNNEDQIIQQPNEVLLQKYVSIQSQIKDQDGIIYSQMQLSQDHGSMVLQSQHDNSIKHQSQKLANIQSFSKNDMLMLIQDYTLNPQVIKKIALKAKYISNQDLIKIFIQQSGQISFVLQNQMKSRGLHMPNNHNNNYQSLFIDQSKIYQKHRHHKSNNIIYVPEISVSFARDWLKLLLKLIENDKIDKQMQNIKLFLKKILIISKNIQLFVTQCLKILTIQNDDLWMKLLTNRKKTRQYYKHCLIDVFFGTMIQCRSGLQIIFYAKWNQKSLNLQISSKQQSKRIIQIILNNLVVSQQKDSSFLINILNYFDVVSKIQKFDFPYFQIQDNIPLTFKIAHSLSDIMHKNTCSFSQNIKYQMIFRVMTFCSLDLLKQFLQIEMNKAAQIIKNSCERQQVTLASFQRSYSNDESIEIQRKAEIYWKLKKSKDNGTDDIKLSLCRRILTDVSVLIDMLKQSTFLLYYRVEYRQMRQQLSQAFKKISEAKHYSQKHQLQLQFKQKQKIYHFWKRNLLNQIIVQQIVPTLQSISLSFLEQLRKATGLLTDLHGLFGSISNTTPALFKTCSECYKLMLAYQNLKKQEEQAYHSMSLLKTLPSIKSTKQATTGNKRRTSRNSSFIMNKASAFQSIFVDLTPYLRRCAPLLSSQALGFSNNDILLLHIHAKFASTEIKLKLLKQENKLGQKVIQVNRQTIWSDTISHIDDNFGDYDIKIKINGEIGLDYGGVTKQWAILIVKQILDPRAGLFQLNVNQLAFQPSKFSYLVPNYLNIFKKFGIFVGKAMKQGWLLQLNLTKSFLKHMLGAVLYVEDLQDLQPDTARGLIWILKNQVDQDLCLNFTYQQNGIHGRKIIQLVPAGNEVQVNQLNKKQYVKKLAYTKMTQNIRDQSMAFISGLEQVIPLRTLKLFNYKQISKFLAGTSMINVQQMKQFCRYEGFKEDDETIIWFWETMSNKSQQDLSQFLFFLTGSYRVPYSGFKQNPISINKMICCKDYLPVAHTCFSVIDLPEYSSCQKLQRMLSKAVKQGKGFTVS